MNFISVHKAREIIEEHAKHGSSIKLDLIDCLGYYAAEEVFATIDVPHFDNSAMDGFCFSYEDYQQNRPIEVNHLIKAGETSLPILQKQEAARIFTGAPLPKGANTVVIQENVEVKNSFLLFHNLPVLQGANIRLQGSQSKKGDLILPKNTQITAGIIGFLAGFGIKQLTVYAQPKVGILVTGNELKEAGTSLKPGEIYESNSVTLKASLKVIGITCLFCHQVEDDKELLKKSIEKALEEVDVLLISGGVSVGDYDYVQEVLGILDSEQLFYKVRQKPGKPLYFGKNKTHYIFGLPGNPASVFSCFHAYVKPFLMARLGEKEIFKPLKQAKLKHDFNKKAGLTQFMKAYIEEGFLQILPNQASYKMNALLEANALAVLEEKETQYNEGDNITYIPI